MNRYDQRMQELNGELVGAHNGCEPILPTEEDIQKMEKALGVALPDDYREFVRGYENYQVDAIFPLQDNPYNVRPGGVGRFYGIVAKQHASLKKNNTSTDIVDSYRPGLIPRRRLAPGMAPDCQRRWFRLLCDGVHRGKQRSSPLHCRCIVPADISHRQLLR